MKKFNLHPNLLQSIYMLIFIVLFLLIIFTPALISGPTRLTNKILIEEEIIEGILLFILFITSVVILNLYQNEVAKHKELIKKINGDKKVVEDKFNESFNYIGKVNVQIQEIKSLFKQSDRFPETRNDFKKSFRILSRRVFGIANANWVLFRIINYSSQNTLGECLETKKDFSCEYPAVSNKMIIENQNIEHFTTIISHPENLNILVFCIIPIEDISNDQRVFVQAILNEIIKLFVIQNSLFSRSGHNLVVQNKGLN